MSVRTSYPVTLRTYALTKRTNTESEVVHVEITKNVVSVVLEKLEIQYLYVAGDGLNYYDAVSIVCDPKADNAVSVKHDALLADSLLARSAYRKAALLNWLATLPDEIRGAVELAVQEKLA